MRFMSLKPIKLTKYCSLTHTFSLTHTHTRTHNHQIQRFDSSGGTETFTSLDYVAPTPEWAVLGHAQRGFDPQETRWHRKSKKDMGGC